VNFIHYVLLALPWVASPSLPVHLGMACDGVNRGVTSAVVQAADYQPLWQRELQAQLADSPVYAGELAAAIASASQETGIDPEMLWSVAYIESHGRHTRDDGRVKRGSHGEVGLMQVQPFWARSLKRVYGIEVDLYNLADNVRAGAYILRRGGDKPAVMLSYYNTGKQLRGCAYQRKVMKYWQGFASGDSAAPATQPSALLEQVASATEPAPDAPADAPVLIASAGTDSQRSHGEHGGGRWGRSWRP